MPNQFIESPPWTSLYGTIATAPEITPTEVVQTQCKWINTDGCRQVLAQIEISKFALLSGVGPVTLTLEGSNDPDGSWHKYVSFNAGASPLSELSNISLVPTVQYGAQQKLYRYLRWNITTDGASAWEVTFRVNVTLKR